MLCVRHPSDVHMQVALTEGRTAQCRGNECNTPNETLLLAGLLCRRHSGVVYGSCHHVQIWVPPSGKDRCALWRMVTKRGKGGEWWKELELFNLKDSRWGCRIELRTHHMWCSRSSRQGPVDGSAQCRGGFLHSLDNWAVQQQNRLPHCRRAPRHRWGHRVTGPREFLHGQRG